MAWEPYFNFIQTQEILTEKSQEKKKKNRKKKKTEKKTHKKKNNKKKKNRDFHHNVRHFHVTVTWISEWFIGLGYAQAI